MLFQRQMSESKPVQNCPDCQKKLNTKTIVEIEKMFPRSSDQVPQGYKVVTTQLSQDSKKTYHLLNGRVASSSRQFLELDWTVTRLLENWA